MKCPNCASHEYCKNGKEGYGSIDDKKQRYKCLLCGYNYTKPKASTGSLKNWGYINATRLRVLALYHEQPGLSYRAIAERIGIVKPRTKPISHGTIRNWIAEHKKDMGEHVPVSKSQKKPAPYSEDDAGHII